jgi:hypothetical protein
MLSEQQRYDVYQKYSPYFIDYCFEYKPFKMSDNKLRTNALVSHTHRLIAVSRNPMTIKSLLDYDNHVITTFYAANNETYDLDVDPRSCWVWSRSSNDSKWAQNYNISSEEELYKYLLIGQKAVLLDNILFNIELYRSTQNKQILDQDVIYVSKYLEAKEILKENIESDDLLDFPFTSGYAKIKNISLQESAKLIILQHNIQSGMLSESENLRLEFTEIVRKEQDITKLKNIFIDFEKVSGKYGSL